MLDLDFMHRMFNGMNKMNLYLNHDMGPSQSTETQAMKVCYNLTTAHFLPPDVAIRFALIPPDSTNHAAALTIADSMCHKVLDKPEGFIKQS